MLVSRPSRQKLSTRIVVVKVQHEGDSRLLGFLVEKMTGTLSLEKQDFKDSGVDNPDTPYLKGVVIDSAGMLQEMSLKDVLSPDACERLFSLA